MKKEKGEIAQKTVFDVAVKRIIPDGAPKASDVVMRSLGIHPRNAADPHDTMKALDDFHVTRLEWAYINNKDYIRKVKESGRVFGGAASAPSYIPAKKDPDWLDKVCVVNLNGEAIIAPWKRAWKQRTLWGCVNNPEMERGYLQDLMQYIDAGSDVMQRDEPESNLGATGWGGCFCPHCMKAFREYLAGKTTPEKRKELGIADVSTFDYREILRKQGAPVGDGFRTWNGGELKQLFVDFQTEATIAFHKRTRKAIDEYAKRRVPFSCNNGVQSWGPIQLEFDWAFGELSYRHAQPDYLYDAMREAAKHDRLQVVTMPKKGNYDNPEAWELLTRQTIAMAYACGGHCMVPWDVYLPADAPRYFGTPEQYADLLGFIRANARYLDGYEEAAVDGKGMKETRWGETAPVVVAGSGDVSVMVRVIPGGPGSAIVVHLIDWSDAPKPSRLILNPNRLFGDRPFRINLLVPTPYVRSEHEAAEKSRSYTSLSKTLPLKGGYVAMVDVPAVRPWGMLIIEPDERQADGVWEPSIWAAEASYCRDALSVAMASASQWSAIRYTTDGGEPTESSPRYTDPIRLTQSTTIKARAFLEGGRSSRVASATFTKMENVAAPLQPNSEGLKPALKLWLNADALEASHADGAPVPKWKATAGPDAEVQSVRLLDGKATAPPTFKADAMNGRPAIRFDGIDDSLAIKGFANQHLAGKAFTILMVTRSAEDGFGISGNGLNGAGGAPRLYLTRGGYYYNVLDKGLSLHAPVDGVAITTFVHDGKDTISAFANGVSTGSVSGLPVVKEFGGGNLAMPHLPGNESKAGDIAEIIVFDRRLSDAEREGVETYLADKYGVPYRRRWQ